MIKFSENIWWIVIAAFGIILLFYLFKIYKDLTAVSKWFEYNKMPKTEEYKRELEENRKNYNKAYANYVAGTQLIALFPMAGILGTVMGLAFGGALSDIIQLIAGLHVALNTTIAGLVCAIALKFFDSVWLGKMVNNIEASFASADSVINSEQMRTYITQAFREYEDQLKEEKHHRK